MSSDLDTEHCENIIMVGWWRYVNVLNTNLGIILFATKINYLKTNVFKHFKTRLKLCNINRIISYMSMSILTKSSFLYLKFGSVFEIYVLAGNLFFKVLCMGVSVYISFTVWSDQSQFIQDIYNLLYLLLKYEPFVHCVFITFSWQIINLLFVN